MSASSVAKLHNQVDKLIVGIREMDGNEGKKADEQLSQAPKTGTAESRLGALQTLKSELESSKAELQKAELQLREDVGNRLRFRKTDTRTCFQVLGSKFPY
jgi:hypothetical protein